MEGFTPSRAMTPGLQASAPGQVSSGTGPSRTQGFSTGSVSRGAVRAARRAYQRRTATRSRLCQYP